MDPAIRLAQSWRSVEGGRDFVVLPRSDREKSTSLGVSVRMDRAARSWQPSTALGKRPLHRHLAGSRGPAQSERDPRVGRTARGDHRDAPREDRGADRAGAAAKGRREMAGLRGSQAASLPRGAAIGCSSCRQRSACNLLHVIVPTWGFDRRHGHPRHRPLKHTPPRLAGKGLPASFPSPPWSSMSRRFANVPCRWLTGFRRGIKERWVEAA